MYTCVRVVRTGPVAGMDVAANTAPVGVAMGALTSVVGFVTAWFIILLLTTSIGLVAAVPRRPAMKLALYMISVRVKE